MKTENRIPMTPWEKIENRGMTCAVRYQYPKGTEIEVTFFDCVNQTKFIKTYAKRAVGYAQATKWMNKFDGR